MHSLHLALIDFLNDGFLGCFGVADVSVVIFMVFLMVFFSLKRQNPRTTKCNRVGSVGGSLGVLFI